MRQRASGILAFFLVVTATQAGAQLSPVTVPRGLFRIEIGGEFRNSDSRFHDGTTEDIARSFTAIPVGSGFFPTLSVSEARIGAMTGNPGYRINLGKTVANGLRNIGTATIGVSYGLTSRITLFSTVPIVRTRMQLNLHFDSSGAEAGLNPNDPVLGTPGGQAQMAAFFGEFDAALATLASKIANGDYDANPPDLALAQLTLAQGTAVRDGFVSVFTDPDAPFVPTAASSAGTALTDTVITLQSTLTSLNVPGFATPPALAASPMSEADFDNLIIAPAGPVRGFPLQEANLNLLGDIEAGASYLLADTWNQNGVPGGFRAAVTGMVRLPTGTVDRPDNFLDVGTGTGHLTAGLAGTVDMGRGRIGARLTAGYEHSFAATIERRVAGPFQPIAFASRLTNVRRQPGGLLDLSVAPFYRIAQTLAVTGGVRLRRHSRDKVSFASSADSLPGMDPSVMAEKTDWSLTAFQAGVTYTSPAALDIARKGFPVEASWMIEGPLSGTGGIVLKERIMRLQFRMYMKLFE